ncbi:MAG TPA: serine/threonine-protein kinase, partial [Thermoanaerobaculia bacterium]
AVHDIDSYEGAPYIVTELLEGETLRSRLVGGALSVRKAIDYAVQIAHGLAAAHEKGIVHRDLKPENLFVTKDGRVKILDFGLAKLSPPPEEGSQVVTMTRQTEPGVLLGTVGYMSPEQARGQALDKRTDIWSLGCVLYEMLVGRPAFAGQTVSDTLAAILDREPDWDSLPGETPPAVAAMLRRCLRKDRERRLHDIADARLELEDTIAGGVKVESSPRAAASAARLPSRGRAIPWGIAAIALLLAAVATWRGERGSAPPPARLQRLSIFPLARSARVGEVDEHAGPLSRR